MIGYIKRMAKEHSFELLIGIASTIFGGIFFDDWNEDRIAANQAIETKAIIIEEIEMNNELLKEAHIYHQSIKTNFDSIAKELSEQELFSTYLNNKKFHFSKIPDWEGFGFADIETSVFEGAKIANILRNLEAKDLHHISRIYVELGKYEEMRKGIEAKLFSINSSTKVIDAISIMKFIVNDFSKLETKLSEKIDKVLNQLSEK